MPSVRIPADGRLAGGCVQETGVHREWWGGEKASASETFNLAPSASQTCIHVTRTMSRLAAKQVRDVFFSARGSKDRWALGVVDRPIEALINPVSQPTARWIEAPPGGFLADPFAVTIKREDTGLL